MRPEQEIDASPRGLNAESAAPAKRQRGCNCGRQGGSRPRAPLLTSDLVIVARDRAREPVLPETTLARALSTPISPRLARYDVVVVSAGLGDEEREARIAAEFARHEHRVFHLGEHFSADKRRTAPALNRITVPATVSRKTTRLVTRSPFLASTVTVTAGGGVIKGLCRLSLFTELRWIAFCRKLDFRHPPVAQKHQG